MGKIFAAAIGNGFVMLVLALLAIKFLGPVFLWLLRAVLEGMN